MALPGFARWGRPPISPPNSVPAAHCVRARLHSLRKTQFFEGARLQSCRKIEGAKRLPCCRRPWAEARSDRSPLALSHSLSFSRASTPQPGLSDPERREGHRRALPGFGRWVKPPTSPPNSVPVTHCVRARLQSCRNRRREAPSLLPQAVGGGAKRPQPTRSNDTECFTSAPSARRSRDCHLGHPRSAYSCRPRDRSLRK